MRLGNEIGKRLGMGKKEGRKGRREEEDSVITMMRKRKKEKEEKRVNMRDTEKRRILV